MELNQKKNMLKEQIGKYAEFCYKFDEEVNDKSEENGGLRKIIMSPDFVKNRLMGDVCNRIINSRMNKNDKEYVLDAIAEIMNICDKGGCLEYISACGQDKWDEAVRETAENVVNDNK